MKIFFAASEMTPYAKTGGLADMVGALPRELAALGHEVICCLPFYRRVGKAVTDAKPIGLPLNIQLGNKVRRGEVLESRLDGGIQVLFVRRDEYFDRTELYNTGQRDYDDNANRFLFFSKAVVELLSLARFRSDVVHCHEWQTAFVPVQIAYRRQTHDPALRVKTVFTIHNVGYQGIFGAEDFPLTNLPGRFFTPESLEFYGKLNLMKGGIVFSDAITTVSRNYMREIQTPEGGHGLDPVLHARQERFFGIANGADYRRWNPATDPALRQNYSAADVSGKRACRADLLHRFDLEADSKTPIVACISRLSEQKGVDTLVDAMEDLLELPLVLIVLGKGEEKYERRLVALAVKRPHRAAARIGFDDELAHKIQAGADLLLVPSKFEPCGLTPMYALKYGTIPVVRATGGLDDNVSQFDPDTGVGTGFKFKEHSARALVDAVRGALEVYAGRAEWGRLMQNAMACDFSWRTCAQEYEKLYATL